jgi:hypothetical protein
MQNNKIKTVTSNVETVFAKWLYSVQTLFARVSLSPPLRNPLQFVLYECHPIEIETRLYCVVRTVYTMTWFLKY